MRLRAAADIMRLGRAVPPWPLEALFAHRAFCARLIFLRAEAERVRLPLNLGLEPVIPVRALMAASRRSRSDWSCLTISSIGMGGIVAFSFSQLPGNVRHLSN